MIRRLFADLGPLTIDAHLPAPALPIELGTTSTGAHATFAATMIGFALGQLVVGPWSDAVGRCIPLAVGAISSCAAAALATDIGLLAVLHFLQGAGASAPIATTLAVARDRYSGAAPCVRWAASRLSRASLRSSTPRSSTTRRTGPA